MSMTRLLRQTPIYRMDLAQIKTPGCSWLLIKHGLQVSMKNTWFGEALLRQESILKVSLKTGVN